MIILPFRGVFVYLIARGDKMGEHEVAEAQAQEDAFRTHVREAAHGDGSADQLAELADLRSREAITEAEFQQGKAKILS